MKRTVIAQQGEVKVYRIDAIPSCAETRPAHGVNGNYIISHSESGHHHVIPCADADVLERTNDVPSGMAILYAIVKNPTALKQTAPTPHGYIPLEPGLYEYRVSRELNPFSEQTRRVMD